MTDVLHFEAGGYRFVPSVFQYSAGVAALPGYRIVREMLPRPVPVAQGFAMIEARLHAQGVPLTRFCACELRSPGQFTDAGFKAFNELYVVTLKRWGVMRDDLVNPVARSNVCPDIGAPAEPAFHAFCYVIDDNGSGQPTAVISGGAEARAGRGSYAERIVRYGENGADAMAEKTLFVVDEMARRLGLLGFGWSDCTAVQAYSVNNFHHVMAEMARRGVLSKGLTWHYARPPVVGLDYEMDCRVLAEEQLFLE